MRIAVIEKALGTAWRVAETPMMSQFVNRSFPSKEDEAWSPFSWAIAVFPPMYATPPKQQPGGTPK